MIEVHTWQMVCYCQWWNKRCLVYLFHLYKKMPMRYDVQGQTKECFVRMNWRVRWLGSSEIPPCFVNHEAVCRQLNSKEISRLKRVHLGKKLVWYGRLEPKFWFLSF